MLKIIFLPVFVPIVVILVIGASILFFRAYVKRGSISPSRKPILLGVLEMRLPKKSSFVRCKKGILENLNT